MRLFGALMREGRWAIFLSTMAAKTARLRLHSDAGDQSERRTLRRTGARDKRNREGRRGKNPMTATCDHDDEFDNTMSICCIHVFEHKRPILFVHRDATVTDGCLEPVQYMCGEEDHYSSKDGRIVCVGHLLEHDPTILPPAAIKPGEAFSRQSMDAPWEVDVAD